MSFVPALNRTAYLAKKYANLGGRPCALWRGEMKEISMDGMRLVHSGDDWAHARPPCSKDMTGFLEHNEKIVSWIQPVLLVCLVFSLFLLFLNLSLSLLQVGGSVDDQIPVVRVNGAYFRLSLRMMKSVWRHIRLKKGFVNREAAPYGGVKLRIPHLLYQEKKRTQARFNVSRSGERNLRSVRTVY